MQPTNHDRALAVLTEIAAYHLHWQQQQVLLVRLIREVVADCAALAAEQGRVELAELIRRRYGT